VQMHGGTIDPAVINMIVGQCHSCRKTLCRNVGDQVADWCASFCQVWEKIDEYMDSRRRDRREKRLQEELKKYRTENPKITEQFADLKRKLADIAESEWEVQISLTSPLV
jgi:PRP1 splicing factor, N-terminal